MKKLLVILMVVAMASFLFVGCLGDGVTPPADDVVDDVDDVVDILTSATPVLTGVSSSIGVAIIDLTSDSTQYVSKAEAGSIIYIQGTAPAESLVSIYLDGVAIGAAVGETSVRGLWSIYVAESALGADGVKVITAKCTEVGLTQSLVSNAATFTLDTVLPYATTLAATADAAVAVGTTDSTGTAIVSAVATTSADIETGTWIVDVLGISGALNNVSITLPDLSVLMYQGVTDGMVFALDAPIPGVTLTFIAALAPAQSIITCVAETDAIVDRAKVGFNEEITTASGVLLTNYTWTTAATAITTAASYYSKFAYFNTFTTGTLAAGELLGCSVNGVVDKAGNIQTTASALTTTVAAASATDLAP